jgi:hypothetical protein
MGDTWRWLCNHFLVLMCWSLTIFPCVIGSPCFAEESVFGLTICIISCIIKLSSKVMDLDLLTISYIGSKLLNIPPLHNKRKVILWVHASIPFYQILCCTYYRIEDRMGNHLSIIFPRCKPEKLHHKKAQWTIYYTMTKVRFHTLAIFSRIARIKELLLFTPTIHFVDMSHGC